jgi:predicted nucleic acid-binding protein
VLLDTDILIDLVRKHPAAIAWLNSQPDLPLVSGFAALELSFGCLNSTELRFIERFLRPFTIVWPTETDVQRALTEFSPLALSHGLGIMDAVIAATALGLAESVGTFNKKHFHAIAGLTTVQPYVH